MITRISRTAPNRCNPLPAGAKFIGAANARYRSPYRVTCIAGIWTVIEPSGQLAVFRDQWSAYEHAVLRYRSTVVPGLLARPAHLETLRGAEQLACSCPEGLPCHGDVLIELLSTCVPLPRTEERETQAAGIGQLTAHAMTATASLVTGRR